VCLKLFMCLLVWYALCHYDSRQSLQNALWIDLAFWCCPKSAIVSHNEADSSNNSISLFSLNEIGCEQRQWGQHEKKYLMRHNVPHTYLKYVNVIWEGNMPNLFFLMLDVKSIPTCQDNQFLFFFSSMKGKPSNRIE